MTINDEGIIDPWVSNWLAQNPHFVNPGSDLDPERLAAARADRLPEPKRFIAAVDDRVIEGVPVRLYRPTAAPTGAIVYFHGGGFVLGSIGIMDNVARELAFRSQTLVISVGYRLAPEHPYPAGLDDCDSVTAWVVDHLEDLDVRRDLVLVAGESAGGNLAAAVCLRLRDRGIARLAGQILIYPSVSGGAVYPSTTEFDGLVITRSSRLDNLRAYCGGRELDDDPYAFPLAAQNLSELPPALVLLAGCDPLRDEGRAYARRLDDSHVSVDEICISGQPHGFINLEFPAANLAFDRIETWLHERLEALDQADDVRS